MSAEAHASKKPTEGSLGTFAGVFTPSVLTILGIILFLRLGYVGPSWALSCFCAWAMWSARRGLVWRS